MKDVFPKITALIFVCLFSALIFWSMLSLAKENKSKRIEKQERIENNYVKHNPDTNF